MLSIKKINSNDKNFSENLQKHISQRKFNTSDIKDKVKDIITEVRKNGDQALIKFSSKYDNFSVDNAISVAKNLDLLFKSLSHY